MALMHLIADWYRAGAGAVLPPPLILTVDHGLRSGAAAEARFVAEQARSLGFDHETLVWSGPKPSSGLQAAARQARYDLTLDRVAHAVPPRDLALAHIQEDQAETLLMRLARGSGIDGLSAMRPRERRVVVALGHPVRELPVDLHRPFLDVSKQRLQAHLRRLGLPWCEDPSNEDVRFERIRLRQSAASLAALGLTSEALSRTARRMRAERLALQDRTRILAATVTDDHEGAFGELSLAHGTQWLAPDLVRLISPILDVFGGAAPPAQLSQIETLADRICSQTMQSSSGVTLGGCLVEIADNEKARRIRVFREFSREPLPTIKVAPGEGIFWDRRFYISVAQAAPGPIEIAPFGATAAGPSDAKLPRRSLAGLPAYRLDETPNLRLLRPPDHAHIVCQWPLQHARRVRWQMDEMLPLETI